MFAESDLVHKAQMGYKTEDIVAGLCSAVASNFLNNLVKGKTIEEPIVFQGGVSRNHSVVAALKNALQKNILVSTSYGSIMGALGIAKIAKESGTEEEFDSKILEQAFETEGFECIKCANSCDLVQVYRNNVKNRHMGQ